MGVPRLLRHLLQCSPLRLALPHRLLRQHRRLLVRLLKLLLSVRLSDPVQFARCSLLSPQMQNVASRIRHALRCVQRPRKFVSSKRASLLHWKLPRTTIAAFPYLAPGQVHLNATRVRKPDGRAFDVTDPWERAAAEAEGRRQVALYERAARAVLPGFAAARVVASGSVLGVRESRRIVGEATLSEADVMQGIARDDRIACCAWPIEDHAPGRSTVWRPLPDGAWYGIPYGALLPAGFANLLVAGRCLSAEHAAQASARISLACLAMGEAAGIAAALGREAGCRPEVAPVQAALRQAGAILDPA